MFDLQVLKSSIYFRKKEILVSDSVNIYIVKFKFSHDWDELAKVVYFTDGFETINVLLDEESSCFIPHEVLQTPKREVKVGVRGTFNGQIILPTIWQSLGKVEKGVFEEQSDETEPPTPELMEQVLTKSEKVARDVVKLSLNIEAMDTNMHNIMQTVNTLVEKVNILLEEPVEPIEPIEPAVVLLGIDITTPPTKIEYTEGEVFDPTGMVVTAMYSDNNTQQITNYTYEPTSALDISVDKIVVSYTEEETTVSANVQIVVKEKVDEGVIE